MNDMTELSECIIELQKRFEKYSKSSLKEAHTRRIFIDPMLKALGWDVENPEEVDDEHRTVDGKAVDYALKINGKVVLLVEAKSLVDPLADVKAITQVVGYASNEGVDWCVLTNGNTYKVYRSTEKASAPDKLLFEVSISSMRRENRSVAEIAEELRRVSRKAMENHALDRFAEQVFSRGRVLKALEKLFHDPQPKLIGMVRDATEDGSITSTQVREAMRGLWSEWQETGTSNQSHISREGLIVRNLEGTGTKAVPIERALHAKRRTTYHAKVQHPPVKSLDGTILATSILIFARNHNPPLKYEGMRTAVDVLTACKSPSGDDYNFHYDVDYRRDGVYIERKAGRGYRTLQEDVDDMRGNAGF